jgi:hypothetical protein
MRSFIPTSSAIRRWSDLLEKLVDSDLQRAVGVAFEGPDSQSPERGFEFTFTRVPDTAEYVTNREDAYSIYRIRMDVRPVRPTAAFSSSRCTAPHTPRYRRRGRIRDTS